MRRLAIHYPLFSFPRVETAGTRFYFDNPLFGVHDAIVLFAMLMETRPKRVVEVGSGFSSRLLLDTNERFFENRVALTLIDPVLETYQSSFGVISKNVVLSPIPLQMVDAKVFDNLERNDILLIDSSHVSKTGSDVNHYLFQILPRLRQGVVIHIHDIFYPFEYPESWIIDCRRSWNEAYAIRAFLQYNSNFEIIYWNNFVYHRLATELGKFMPLCLENEGGSLWLRKI